MLSLRAPKEENHFLEQGKEMKNEKGITMCCVCSHCNPCDD